jgi:uncharacterized membrane protein YcaP (DUF421 family)
MIVVFIRTLLVYLMVTAAMRLMGKRQIGQLEVSELITTLLLSEIATLPIENPDIPLLYALIPCVTLLTLEVCTAFLLSRRPRLRHKLEARPSMLIRDGQVDQGELAQNRMSVEELFAGLRQQGIADPGEVYYAIMEKNGQLSVIPKAAYRPVEAGEVKGTVKESGIAHLLVCDGKINQYNLGLLGHDERWLKKQLDRRGLRAEDLLYFLCDDAGGMSWMRKEDKE